jgi:hypothetical protein
MALTSLFAPMPSLTMSFSRWLIALRMIWAISLAGLRPRKVEISFVYRRLLDIWREIAAIPKHLGRELLIPLEISRKNDQFWAELTGLHGGHRHIYAAFASFIRGGGDDAAFLAADRHSLATQLRIGGLFHCDEEGIGVEVDDGSRTHNLGRV